MSNHHKWTIEQIQYLRKHTYGRSHKEITDLLNSVFCLNLDVGRVKGMLARYKISTGRTGRFEKGKKSWNAGKKGNRYSPATEFKKGQMPVNHRPVGSERIDNKDGYILIKTSEPKTWKHKHRVVWEAAYGPVPAGHVIVFAEQNKNNMELDNLLLVSRGELAVLNKQKLLYGDKDLNKTGIALAQLIMKKHEINRK